MVLSAPVLLCKLRVQFLYLKMKLRCVGVLVLQELHANLSFSSPTGGEKNICGHCLAKRLFNLPF